MTTRFKQALLAATLSVAGIGSAQAMLIDRGGGLIYDDVLNVTWMQDAQIAISMGLTTTGMGWQNAMDFASSLSYYDSVRGVTWTDWRLPTFDNALAVRNGYDTTGASSELAYMYYVNLGYAPNYSHDRTTPSPTSGNYNPFVNLAYRGYWSSTPTDFANREWAFHFHFGSNEFGNIFEDNRIWAVRDGDVAALANNSVPEPGTLALLGLGLLGLGGAKRRKPR